MPLDRASFLATLAGFRLVRDPVAAIERARGGTIGVAAIDVATGPIIRHRAHERFPLASTWKLPLVMALLARVDAGRERLGRTIRFTPADLEPPYGPIAQRYPHGGSLALEEICRLTISDSDNTGADLLGRLAGGPSAVTSYLRSIGVDGVRIDRFERELPSRAPRTDPRDTGTPEAMAMLAARLVNASPLSPASTALLLRWMRGTTTGGRRLRAGVPRGWTVADKTGTYQNVANDVGLLFPPGGTPIAIACYTIDVPGDGGSAAIADAARAVTVGRTAPRSPETSLSRSA
jgi:beta-lactamase class A